MIKLKLLSLISLVILNVITISSCSSTAQNAENDNIKPEDTTRIQILSEKEYQEDLATYKKETYEELSSNELLIADIKVRLKDTKDDIKSEYKIQIDNLEQQNNAIKIRLDEYQEEGNEKWQHFRAELNHDMDMLGQSLMEFSEINKQ